MSIAHFYSNSQFERPVAVDKGLTVGPGASSGQGEKKELEGSTPLELESIKLIFHF
jgi:hypothetical protein